MKINNICKRLTAIMLAFLLAFSGNMTAVFAAGGVVSGTCGASATWELDTSTGVLTVSGTGAMDNYKDALGWTDSAPWDDYVDDITSVTVGDGITCIGNNAFYSCDNLVSVTLPDSLISMGDGAFCYCNKLASVALPAGLTSMGEGAFFFCTSLESVDLSHTGITALPKEAFYYCTKLASVTLPDGLTSMGEKVFEFCEKLQAVDLSHTGITVLPNRAFFSCDSLASVALPVGVVSMGEGAFSYCSALESVDLSHTGITAISKDAFNQCEKLKTVIFPDGLTAIGEAAFYSCNLLEKLVLPESVSSIATKAFMYTGRDWELHKTGNAPTLEKDVFADGNYCGAPKVVVYGKDASGYDVTGTFGSSTFVQPLWGQNVHYINQINSRDIEVQTQRFGVGLCAPIIDGKAEPEVKVYDYTGEKLLTEGVDYTVSYIDNTQPSNDIDTPDEEQSCAYAVVTGMGQYGGVGKAKFYALESGICGDDAMWMFEPINQNLYIYGSGEMYDYSAQNPAPWANIPYNDISIEGVSTIGDNAFANKTQMNDVYLYTPMAEIGAGAFSGCRDLSYVSMQGNAPAVAPDVFDDAADDLRIYVGGPVANGYCGEPWDGLDIYFTERIVEVDVTDQTVAPQDKDDLLNAKERLEQALTNNYSEQDKQLIEDEILRVEQMLTIIENVENATDLIKELPETVQPDDEQALAAIADAKEFYDALTDYEKALIDIAFKEKLEDLQAQAKDYKFVDGHGDTWVQGGSAPMRFVINGLFDKFVGVEIDGNLLDTDHYTAASGSTLIDLKADYLKTLSQGQHTITVLYTDGSVTESFTISAAPVDDDNDDPAGGNGGSNAGNAGGNNGSNTGNGGDINAGVEGDKPEADSDRVESPETGDDRQYQLCLALSVFGAAAAIIPAVPTIIKRKML